MPQKTGNGGHGQENYDEKTGRYVASSGFSKDELKDFIENGKLDASDPETQEIIDTYNSLQNDEEKEEFLDALNEFLAEQHTQELHAQEFVEMTSNEYSTESHKQWQTQLPAQVTINGHQYSRDDLVHAATGEYFGKGWVSFEEQKARRYYQKYGDLVKFREYLKDKYGDDYSGSTYYDPKRGITRPTNLLSDEHLYSWFERMDYITTHCTAPRDMRVGRYLNDNWFVSCFKHILPQGTQLVPDGFGYEKLGEQDLQKKVDLMYDVLSNMIGNKIPADGSYPSCSCVPSQTHVGNNDEDYDGNDIFRNILLNIDVPKGHGIFMGDYGYESEACLERNSAFFIKDVKKVMQTTDSGRKKPRVIITVGMQEKKQ